ncbi:MAG: aminoacyl-tRNA hydrolase [Planctomycetes bacterium]|nr:aminoacyl-tRNA hydrolase [Planctomycetota bacterium]
MADSKLKTAEADLDESPDDVLAVTPRIQIPHDEFAFQFARSSGPGGQNVNKVNSKAMLRWRPLESPSLPDDVRQRFAVRFASKLLADGSILISCEKSRSQLLNRIGCLEQLAGWLKEVAVPPKKRRPTKPTKGSKTRRLNDKRRHSDTKRMRGSLGDD